MKTQHVILVRKLQTFRNENNQANEKHLIVSFVRKRSREWKKVHDCIDVDPALHFQAGTLKCSRCKLQREQFSKVCLDFLQVWGRKKWRAAKTVTKPESSVSRTFLVWVEPGGKKGGALNGGESSEDKIA